MPAAETARLLASLELQDKFSKTADAAIRKTGQIEKGFGNLGKTASTGVGIGFRNLGKVFAGVGVAALIREAITQASDLAETQSKVNVVFGESAKKVTVFSETAATALGTSREQALAASATFGNLFVSMGLTQDRSADMSTKLVTLASDLASFNNIDPTEALEKLRSGLVGEAEPLRSLGINLNDATLRQKALELGLVKTTKQVLPPAIKAQAAYALIFEQSKTAQGDFARTSSGLANQQRILKGQFKDTAAILGTAVLPRLTDVFGKVTKFVQNNQPQIQALAAQLPAIFDKAAAFAGSLPWDKIGSGVSMAADAAGHLIGAFANAPPEVQALIIGLAGLNKISGGAVGSIVTELGKGLIKGVLGMTAGVVNINAATVKGVGTGVGGDKGGGGGPGGFIGIGGLVTIITTTIAAAIAAGQFDTERIQNLGLVGRTQEQLRFAQENHFPDADIDKLTKRLAALQSGKFDTFIAEQSATGQSVDDVNRTLDTRLQIEALLQRDANRILNAALTRPMPAPIVLNNIDVNISGRDLTSVEVQQKLIAGGFDMFEH